MHASFDAPKPEIKVFHVKNAVPKDVITEILLGIEEEGLPYSVEEKDPDTALYLAYQAAEASHLGVGIGIDSSEIVLHHIKLKEDEPLFSISAQNTEENYRSLGANAARVIKRMPFKAL